MDWLGCHSNTRLYVHARWFAYIMIALQNIIQFVANVIVALVVRYARVARHQSILGADVQGVVHFPINIANPASRME